jgi:hypothetical protein
MDTLIFQLLLNLSIQIEQVINNIFQPKLIITSIIYFLLIAPAFCQNKKSKKPETLIVKTNLLNLAAKGPSISFEKFLSKSFSFVLAYMKGQFNDFLLTDHYDYNGLLLRGKKYFHEINKGDITPYIGAYTGVLHRNIHTVGQSGLFGYPDRDFSANSIRSGFSMGGLWLLKNNFVIDLQSSLGYGRYINIDKNDPDTYSNGYLDIQIWTSVGYYF